MDKNIKKNGHLNTCFRCGKPVFFAERKTSLGKDWHPHCLKCLQCGKVLAPGQHAEHKGMPYCHKPCYGALFGPQMFGYGSNVSSPANFRKSSELDIGGIQNDSISEETPEGMTCIFKTIHSSPSPIKLQRNGSNEALPKYMQKRHSSGSVESGYHSNSENIPRSGSSASLDTVSEKGNDSGLKCVYQSSVPTQTPSVRRSNSDVVKLGPSQNIPQSNPLRIRGAELFKRVQSYNENHQSKRGQTLDIMEEEGTGNVRIQGPLRIYWGLKKPIILKQCDEVPSKPIPKKRYSVVTDTSDLQQLPEILNESHSPKFDAKSRGGGGFDDSVLSSPLGDVVMRRTHIKKSNTVAYRGEKPNRWKRASINGHIYNYDTSVFTPVLGSCTSVTVNNKMTVRQVIKTLLDKFKVENEQDEYNLCIISEREEERLLKDSDIPLLERLLLGPTDSVKLYIRDRPSAKPAVAPAHIPGDSSPTTETPTEDIPLPEEVEQLLDIPEPVLRGLLEKFKGDEEMEVRRLRNKYERIRKRVQQIIADKKANVTRC